MTPDTLDTTGPLWQWLFWLVLGTLILVLLERLPKQPVDQDAEARRAFNERMGRELAGKDV